MHIGKGLVELHSGKLWVVRKIDPLVTEFW
jgi:hypothetical protein